MTMVYNVINFSERPALTLAVVLTISDEVCISNLLAVMLMDVIQVELIWVKIICRFRLFTFH